MKAPRRCPACHGTGKVAKRFGQNAIIYERCTHPFHFQKRAKPTLADQLKSLVARVPQEIQANDAPVIAPRCYACHDKGYFRVQRDDGNTIITPCSCTKAKRKGEQVLKAGIPRQFWPFTLQETPAAERQSVAFQAGKTNPSYQGFMYALAATRHVSQTYIKRFMHGEAVRTDSLYLHGLAKGKSFLAAALAIDLIDAGMRHVVFADYKWLFASLREAMDSKGQGREYPSDIVQRLAKADVLILDDFWCDCGVNPTWQVDVIGGILGKRYHEGRPTVITSGHWPAPPSSQAPPIPDQWDSWFAQTCIDVPMHLDTSYLEAPVKRPKRVLPLHLRKMPRHKKTALQMR